MMDDQRAAKSKCPLTILDQDILLRKKYVRRWKLYTADAKISKFTNMVRCGSILKEWKCQHKLIKIEKMKWKIA